MATLLRRWFRERFGRPAAPPPPVLRLDDVRRRLEVLLAALYGREIPIVPAESKPAGRNAAPAEVAGSDGQRIHLPPQLDAAGGTEAALARYRLMAIGQAERMLRGTVAAAPGEDDRLVRDLYLLMESAAADAAIAESIPRMRPALEAERASALARRPAIEEMKGTEREVEGLVRALLARDAADPPAELAPGDTPEASLARARALAERLRAARGRYRGVPAVGAWGTVIPLPVDPSRRSPVRPPMYMNPMTLPGSRQGRGFSFTASRSAPPGSPQIDDPFSKQQRSGGDAPPSALPPTGAGGGDGPSDDGTGESDKGGGKSRGKAKDRTDARSMEAAAYPEWDTYAGAYQQRAVWVRPREASEGDEAWPAAVLEANAALVRRLRERFERLRAQRSRLPRQRDGEELDLEACVRAFADRATGHSVDDRLYLEVRPARRGLAIALLMDISGSTSEIVGNRRIIDIEKIALLLTSEALDALGDLYAILTFSGAGADDVRMRTLKDFGERNGTDVRRRISALQPEGYTRMGAAIRHATALLARQNAGHRLLLILSDGKPNDQDHYQDRFAVEDSRQAIAEARSSGVHPFCITVDRKASSYLTRIFGEPGHMILRRADQLPLALVKVVRQILSNR
ncbi:nitric oxide reductase activation protein NorD [Longimicrobium sp.]|uniref:nitric oxide reductase activation protein NorD n=1 Tax=Longimicrobium sp. TaxID=2029185 RepID=UPI002E2F9346|nr:VWA domain-containing protein [Longimicrobium sp.]HEX6037886.1 VWA domain-containing protein [Longimicrobium sp.]